MELPAVEWRTYCKIRALLGLSAKDIHTDLVTVSGQYAPSYRTVADWVARFKAGRESIEDDPREGRPTTSRAAGKIAAARTIVDENSSISVDELAEALDISHGAAHQILTDDLGLRSILAKWVPHDLTETQRQCRVETAHYLVKTFRDLGPAGIKNIVSGDETYIYYDMPEKRRHAREWVAKNAQRPQIARPNLHAKKNCYSIFISNSGPIAQIPGPENKAINGSYVVDRVLPSLMQGFRSARPNETMLLHWDNARPHHSAEVHRYLEANGISVLRHPAYSPDLSPCDFWLFSILKDRLAGQSYSTPSQMGTAIYQCLKVLPKEAYQRCFENWEEKLKLCIEHGGEYI
jgi:[histone H3]-lysine36 N-dimethyltransferase SETMAR